DDVLKAAGKTATGEHGVRLTLRDVKKHEDGRVEMHVTVERPADVLPYSPSGKADAAGAAPAGPAQIQVRPIQIRAVPPPAPRPAAPGPPPPPPPTPPPPKDKAPNPAPNAVPPRPNPAPQPQQAVPVKPVQAQGAAARARDFGSTFVGLSALDAKGERLPLSDARSLGSRSVNGVITQEVAVTFQPGAGQGDPAKPTFTGTRNNSVDIPLPLNHLHPP